MTFYNLLENVLKKIKKRLHICRFMLKLLCNIAIPIKILSPWFDKICGVYFLRVNWKRFQIRIGILIFYQKLETFPTGRFDFLFK